MNLLRKFYFMRAAARSVKIKIILFLTDCMLSEKRRCRPAFSADRRKPAAIVPDDRGLMLCFDIPGSMPWGFPRDKKGYLYHNSCRRTSYDRELIRLKPRFQTRDFAERCSDKVRVAICAPHAAHSIALRSIKTVIHAPGFYGFALQILSKLRFAQVI